MLRRLIVLLTALVASIGMALAAININTATEQELETLPGVGASKAKAIVDYRKANGNFKAIEDIKNVKGIGDKIFEKLKSQITVSGASTVTQPSKAKQEGPKVAQSGVGAKAKK